MILTTTNNIKFKIDDTDFESVVQHKWNAEPARHGRFYITRKIGKNRVWLHRFILGLSNNRSIQVDHINGDSTDNRKVNLRICEKPGQNAINRPKQKNNTSGYKGVFFRKDTKKYRACIRVDQKLIHLGQYDNVIEAAKAYNAAAVKYFGNFAFLNKLE